jgi:hypothetical protein
MNFDKLVNDVLRFQKPWISFFDEIVVTSGCLPLAISLMIIILLHNPFFHSANWIVS